MSDFHKKRPRIDDTSVLKSSDVPLNALCNKRSAKDIMLRYIWKSCFKSVL